MRVGAGDERCHERPGVAFQIQMVRQYARRLEGVDGAFPARPKVCDEALDRRVGADERPSAPPGDQVDVRIALHKHGRRLGCRPRTERRQSLKTGGAKPVHEVGGDPVPRRNEHGHEAWAESLLELRPADLQFGDDCFDRPMITELPIALTRWGVVAMRVSVLQDGHGGRLLQAFDQALLEQRRDRGQRDGNICVHGNLEERVKRGRIAAGIVVAPPELGATPARLPEVELTVERSPGAQGCALARSAMSSPTIDALREAPSLSKSHVPHCSRVPAESTAAARISGVQV